MKPLTKEEIVQNLYGVSSATMNAVNAKVDECYEIADSTFGRQFAKPEIVYDLKGTTAGIADSKENKLRLNAAVLNNPKHYEDMVNDTVPHEIAHLITDAIDPYAKAHGWKWRQIAELLGARPERCHAYDVVPSRKQTRYQYTCDCNPARIHNLSATKHWRIVDGKQIRFCKICHATLRPVEE